MDEMNALFKPGPASDQNTFVADERGAALRRDLAVSTHVPDVLVISREPVVPA